MESKDTFDTRKQNPDDLPSSSTETTSSPDLPEVHAAEIKPSRLRRSQIQEQTIAHLQSRLDAREKEIEVMADAQKRLWESIPAFIWHSLLSKIKH